MTSRFRKVVYAGVSIFAVFALLMTSTLPMYANDAVEEEVIEKVETEEVVIPEIEEETIVEDIEATEDIVAEIEDEIVEPIAEVLADEEPAISPRAVDVSNVENVTELKEAVAAAQSGDTITLATDFVSGTETINIGDKTLTIDGNGSVSKGGTLTVEGTGTLTIKDMKFDGEGFDQNLLVNKISGSLIIENSEFYNSSKAAFNAASPGKTEINRTEFYNNTSGRQGVAIWLSSQADVTINHSTIKDNIGTGGGYESGAIASKSFSGKLRINNTVVENNVNKGANTNVLGGGGGAIFINMFYGEIWINESIFRGNSTNGADGSKAATYDGGAIYLFNMSKGAIFNVDKSAFIDNIAYDDGGAILIQTEGSGNGDLVDGASITNSTFFGNKAYGVGNAVYSGGAIQIYANVGFSGELHTEATIVGNTFVNNTVGGIPATGYSPSGSAIGLSTGLSWASSMKVTIVNNSFAGNLAIGSNGVIDEKVSKIISDSDYIANDTYKTDNIGLADGKTSTEYRKAIFGDFPEIKAVSNSSSVTSGVDDETVPSVPIIPEGLAENTHPDALTGTDQRGAPRYKDFGAVEASWVKYNANGGEYKLTLQTEYDGSSYYVPVEEGQEDAGKIVDYYSVGKINGSSALMVGEDINIEHSDKTKVFLGWATTKDATEPNVSGPLTGMPENTTLYAVWGDAETYTVSYNANGGEGDVPVDPQEYLLDALAVVLENNLVKKDHIFKGWSLTVDGTGTLYQTGDEVVVKVNTTFYAVWEKMASFSVTYDANGGEGDVPLDSQEYFLDALAVVLENNLVKKDHIFKGWSLSVDGTGTLYQTGDEVVVQGDTILFAVWEKVEAPVKPIDPTDPVKPVESSPVLPSTGVASSTHWLAFLVAGFAILILKNYKREQH